MNVQDIKTYIRVEEELHTLCDAIFEYVIENYIDQLKFGKFSLNNKYFISKTGLCIEYYDRIYDMYDCSWLPDIPLESLESESSWQKFLDDYYKKKIEEEEEKKAKAKKMEEYKEREMLRKLKEKYGE